MKSLNLKPILYCIKQQKKNKTYNKNTKIGLIDKNATESCLDHYKKEPVLFSTSIYDHDTVTIEKPMDKKWMEDQRKNGSLLTTYCTMVGVPQKYIMEIEL